MPRKTWQVVGAAALVAALIIEGPAAQALGRYSPPPGVAFNNPVGDVSAKRRILTHVTRTIASTPRRATIRIAAYSVNSRNIARALVAAHRRGVHVQVLVHHVEGPALKRMQRVLGKNRGKRSFARRCMHSCRGSEGHLHSKIYLFTRAGKSRNVVMFGSSNLSIPAADLQWNDLYTAVANRRLMSQYVTIFEEMRRDRPTARPHRVYTAGRIRSSFFPRPRTARDDDPVMSRLNAVRCFGAAGGAGTAGRTTVRINMSAWEGDRGVYLARKVMSKWNQGCDMRVIYGVIGDRVKAVLTGPSSRGRLPVRIAARDRDRNGLLDLHTHTKYLLVSGRFRRDPSSWIVWTGSTNWSDRAIRSDELTVRISRRGAFARYRAHFRHLWTLQSTRVTSRTTAAAGQGTAFTRRRGVAR